MIIYFDTRNVKNFLGYQPRSMDYNTIDNRQ